MIIDVMKGFIVFIREQGVVGLAIGFILGGAISKVVASFVEDIVNPLLGVVLGATGALDAAVFRVGSVEILWGSFVSTIIDFLIIALVIFYGFKLLRLDRLDKKK